MPPSSEEAWIDSSELPRIPRQTLRKDEVNAFLDFLFSDVARKPAEIRLLEGAAVARYLVALAWRLEPGEDRHLLERLGDVIWETIFQVAPFQISKKQQAVRFLKRHAASYLSWFDVERALASVKDNPRPRRAEELFRADRLRSGSLGVGGPVDARSQDDLTERICGAYYALRQAEVYDARGKIAQALNRHGLRSRVRRDVSRKWGSAQVYERVKQCESRFKKAHGSAATKDQVKEWRHVVAQKWLFLSCRGSNFKFPSSARPER